MSRLKKKKQQLQESHKCSLRSKHLNISNQLDDRNCRVSLWVVKLLCGDCIEVASVGGWGGCSHHVVEEGDDQADENEGGGADATLSGRKGLRVSDHPVLLLFQPLPVQLGAHHLPNGLVVAVEPVELKQGPWIKLFLRQNIHFFLKKKSEKKRQSGVAQGATCWPTLLQHKEPACLNNYSFFKKKMMHDIFYHD